MAAHGGFRRVEFLSDGEIRVTPLLLDPERLEALNALHGHDGSFLLIKGEEVTDRFDGKPVHVNGLDVAERFRNLPYVCEFTGEISG